MPTTSAAPIPYQIEWPTSMPRGPPRSGFRTCIVSGDGRRYQGIGYIRRPPILVANWCASCAFSLDYIATLRYNIVIEKGRSRKVFAAPHGP